MSTSATARVICDSVCPAGIRLTTIQCRYPRIIHQELLTHCAFVRNARSSRAVPAKRMVDEVRQEPFIPSTWGANQKGMQAGDPLPDDVAAECRHVWEKACEDALVAAERLAALGVHKQWVNRVLEPYSYIDTLITATDWNNFFALRLHPDAQPEIQGLAGAIRCAMGESEPRILYAGQWHLPYIDLDDRSEMDRILRWGDVPNTGCPGVTLAKVSAARCRRISYTPWDGSDASIEADLARFDEMVAARPMHASPLGHQGMATGDPNVRSGNFRGYVQFRQMIKGHVAAG